MKKGVLLADQPSPVAVTDDGGTVTASAGG